MMTSPLDAQLLASPPCTEGERIYLSPPDMTGLERASLLRAFDSGWVAPAGPELSLFEKEMAEFVGVRYAVALSSGTAALHLALKAVGVQQGTDVLTSTLTFVATANAIRYLGANPIFIDSERSSWNMDPDLLEAELRIRRARGQRNGAVLAVDIFGQCADYSAICDICDRYSVPLIEDAAEALGAQWMGKSAGSFGAIGCFSFNGNKILTTGGGGMLVTNHQLWAEKARHWATQAKDPALHYEHSELGYNYRLSNLLAGIGRAQLSRLNEIVAKRRAIFKYYEQQLGHVPGISFMPEPLHSFSNRWLTCMLLEKSIAKVGSEELIQKLAEANIESRPVWKPMHLQPLYLDFCRRGGAVSEELFRSGICLPSGTSMSEVDLGRVCDVVQSCLTK